MNSTFKRFAALASLAVAAFAAIPSAQAQSVIWHRSSGTEWNKPTGLAGLAHQPKGYYLFNHGYPDATTYAGHTNWNVNDFTGAGIPVTANNQVSHNTAPVGYGSTSFQMGGGKAATFLNAYGHQSPIGMDYKIDGAFGGTVDNNAVNNWSLSPSAQVCFSTKHKVSYFGGETEPKVQSYFSVFLHDTRLNKGFNLTIKMWANRVESHSWEGAGGSEVGRYVYAVISPTSAFTTKQAGSSDAILGRVPSGEDTWFHTCITRANLANIIATYNSGLPEADKISWNVDDYRLTGAFVQTEVMDLRYIIDLPSWTLGAVKTPSLMHVGVTWSYHDIVTIY